MRLIDRSTWLLFAFAIALLTSCQPLPPESIEQMLPLGVVNAEILGVQFPKRATELTVRLEKSVSQNQSWFIKYNTENAKVGEPLPYHPNFGLTEEEYRELLALAEQRKVVINDHVNLAIIKEDGVYKINSDGRLPTLDGTTINANDRTVITQFGTLRNPEKTSSDGTDSPIGPFRGYKWYFEEGSMKDGNARAVSFSLESLNDGKTFIEFRANVLEQRKQVVKEVLALRFAATKPNSLVNTDTAQAPRRLP